MNSSQANQVSNNLTATSAKHIHNKLTINPLIYDEPEITLANVSNIMDYLLTADDYLDSHIQDKSHRMYFVVAREALINLSKQAIDYEAHRIETTFEEISHV